MGGLLALVASLSFSQAASADVGAACTVTGSATADVGWSANKDTYNFGPNGLNIVCVGGGTVGGAPHKGAATITSGSTGHFDNITCGTGSAADGTPSTTTVIGVPGADDTVLDGILANADLSYQLTFAAGQGVLNWADQGGVDTPALGNPNANTAIDPTSKKPVGGGYINISPFNPVVNPGQPFYFPGPTPGSGLCTHGFNVAGALVGVLGA
jgi:hypothetical protein